MPHKKFILSTQKRDQQIVKKRRRKNSIIAILDLREVFEGFDCTLCIVYVGVRLGESRVDVLRYPLGLLRHFLPLLQHVPPKFLIFRAHNPNPILHCGFLGSIESPHRALIMLGFDLDLVGETRESDWEQIAV
ncbi:hypothetical protein HS088_TW21G01460 [Tripterygium wilfordii]|uniref:Uncharacterized protein n=1 Tax=Tripterygium wilfordii TaxID=458696 RepID=A0A7J7C627_TRIWF|nr:hypothetical protein HS088_TW21G01460 [Tripterygium wilfordii]